MDNFLIGFYGKCDEEKFNSDFRKSFCGVEACMFPSIDEVVKLDTISKTFGFNLGAHYPLIKKDSITRDPLFISLNEDERNNAFSDFEKEAQFVSQFNGKYLLTHFPKPVLVSDAFDFTYWRFANDKEWIYEKSYPIEQLNQNLFDMFEKLTAISKRTNIQIVLENDAISPYLYKNSIIVDLFNKFTDIMACLDIGRLNLNQIVDSNFNGYDFASKIAPFTYLIHLWNANPKDNFHGGHLPVSPLQKSENGYADVEKYLDLILGKAPNAKILFEHQSSNMTKQELDSCYHWINDIQQGCCRK